MGSAGLVVGSSPLTRGAPHPRGPLAPRSGIIPAHAGSTLRFLVRGGLYRDHPRSRGEHAEGVTAPRPAWGSSPLTRGALRDVPRRDWPAGIIPAHAGSTHRSDRPARSDRDHPRSRGEHLVVGDVEVAAAGSSPLTRGALCLSFCDRVAARIIPAHAGSTARLAAVSIANPDHPRSRGEHSNPQGCAVI